MFQQNMMEAICFHCSVARELHYKGLVHKCEGAFTKHSFHKKKDCEYKAERYLRG